MKSLERIVFLSIVICMFSMCSVDKSNQYTSAMIEKYKGKIISVTDGKSNTIYNLGLRAKIKYYISA